MLLQYAKALAKCAKVQYLSKQIYSFAESPRMTNYAKSRKTMVECQLEPNNITSEAILEAFDLIPREAFVPEDMKGIAYADEDLSLGARGFLQEPVVLARMLEVAKLDPSENVLNIGDCTGYSAAVLANLVRAVVTIEDEQCPLTEAKAVWAGLNATNISLTKGDYAQGCAQMAPYDLILINGAMATVPTVLLSQLSDGGRLVGVLKESGRKTGSIVMIKRIGDAYSTQKFFDAAAFYVRGFEPVPAFIF